MRINELYDMPSIDDEIVRRRKYGRGGSPEKLQRRSYQRGMFHLNVKSGSRGRGQSAKAKYCYIAREDKYKNTDEKRLEKSSDSRKELRLVSSGNLPTWANDAKDFWEAADLYERENGRLFTQVEFALPVQLSNKMQLNLAKQYANKITDTPQGKLPYTLAIHEGKGTNPHVHLMINERADDGVGRAKENHFKRANSKLPERGGAKKYRGIKSSDWVMDIRKDYAVLCNAYMRAESINVRFDSRTLEAQGIDRLPQVHVGHGKSQHKITLAKKNVTSINKALELINREIKDGLIKRNKLSQAVQRQTSRRHSTLSSLMQEAGNKAKQNRPESISKVDKNNKIQRKKKKDNGISF